MKPIAYICLLLLMPCGLAAETSSDILPPSKRALTLELARTLLTFKTFESSDEALAAMNPFNPVQPVTETVEMVNSPIVVVPALSERDLLKSMADGITPSGMMQMAGRQVLLFGQKKLKVGDHIPVTYQGTAYELEVIAIDRTSFTLRLKNEEITRPIKAQVKKP